MNDEIIQELYKLNQEATQGKWVHWPRNEAGESNIDVSGGLGPPLARTTMGGTEGLANAALIVAMRNALPELLAEFNKMQEFIKSLGVKNVPCRCGSGGHPRKCERHPWAFDAHVAELNAEGYQECEDENDNLKAQLEKCMSEIKKLREQIEQKHG